MLRLRALVAALVAVSLPVTALAAHPAAAAPLTADPAVAADLASVWLAGQVGASGFIPNGANQPDVSSTLDAALALAASGTDHATFDRILSWLQANALTVITPNGSDDPGRIGALLMLAHLAGITPTQFGGLDLPARLAATLGTLHAGLYGDGDPTYDGVYRQSLALMGLHAIGAPLPVTAVDWLVAQQCGATPSSATGGFLGYRADTTVDCPAPDPNTFSGPDTNSTAIAVEALAAAGRSAAVAAGLDFLAAAEGADGGFAFIPGGGADPNSEALVIQAIVAGGENPSAGRWVKGNATPVTALLTWQLGTTADAADQGALASPYSNGAPDVFATRQGIWGLVGAPFPLAAAAFPPPATTTTTVAPSTTSTTTPVVQATPAFTG